ncbi:ATP-binding protein [Streptomyces sp. NBC_01716]|uniref:ATP-binding protein n=1 Tax=Streptomyces sp. NBC_01716 TaxID=2975917 RepID=UPI002E35425C|nr:ATP-binding protein [Streptomyces sp. NBC_01716]
MAGVEAPAEAGGRFFQVAFAADVAHVASVRCAVRELLGAWGLESFADVALLAAGELMANAIQHGCGNNDETVTVSAWCTADELLIGVGDPSSVQPRRRFAGERDESGRGLELVAAMVDRWGSELAPGRHGKRVWIAFRTTSKEAEA